MKLRSIVFFFAVTNFIWAQNVDSLNINDIKLKENSWNTLKYKNLSLTLYGKFAGEAIFTSDATGTRSFILYALGRTAKRAPQATITGQSTAIGILLDGLRINTWKLSGNVLFDFHGSRPSLNETGAYLLNAYAEISNQKWRFRFGAMEDLIAPLNPIMVNWTTSGAAGNLGGTYRGHFRADYFTNPNESVRWVFSAAISQTVVNDKIETERGIVQDNGLPNFIGRIGMELGDELKNGDAPFEIGLSGLYTQHASAIETGNEKFISDAYALALDFRWEWNKIGLGSEAFIGQGLGTHMGGIGQTVNLVTAEPIRSKGGFGQVWFRPIPKIMLSVVYGIDDPDNNDLSPNQRSLNRLLAANMFLEIYKGFEFAIEIGRWNTDYIAPSINNYVNVLNCRFQYSY